MRKVGTSSGRWEESLVSGLRLLAAGGLRLSLPAPYSGKSWGGGGRA